MTTFKKLKNGDWGIRVEDEAPEPGASLTVRKRDGSTSTVTVDKVLWRGQENDKDIALCSIKRDEQRSEGRRSYGRSCGRRRSCPTGGNCSSFGDGRSCGADDCDGY